MEAFTHLFLYSFLFSLFRTSITLDTTITPSQSLRDGGTLLSAGGSFQLGFFSPGNSKSRYVGIWYTKSLETVVWVANRDAPLYDHSGVLKVTDDGVLVLLNSTNGTVWSSSKTSKTVENPVAQLLDSGNLVVKDVKFDEPENFMWQSFDYPCDTFLPEMKLGWNLVTGLERFLSSWKSTDDPAQGAFSLRLDIHGYPQFVTTEGSKIKARVGSWNGIHLTGHGLKSVDPLLEYEFVLNEKEALRNDSDGWIGQRVGSFSLHSRQIGAIIMPYAAHMLLAISITLLYVHVWKASYPSLQKIGIQQIGLMGVFEGLLWNAITKMVS
ncbi:G-type lectin S-receptor-like serine/threonine-protein kinase At4g27290 [Alnus glutinosa]|uniref:G-type lectin S-receptor-like serine/threonine-protein kinase At4g27290 n=1 Tax=Alnus glutinosa TaxID=3517 RepID=UPI002D770834|nr:G-type lectin S-receptor-like serine/threonine-protein kinase At4g27290 [Alnus glutinosa]